MVLNFKKIQTIFKPFFILPTRISYTLKKLFYLPSWKSLSFIKFMNLKYFQMEFKYSFSKNPFHFKWKKSCHLHTSVMMVKWIWIPRDQKSKRKPGKVISFPLIKLLKSFKFHSISHNQSLNNQTNRSELFI